MPALILSNSVARCGHAAEPGRGKHQPARLRLGEGDKLGQRSGRHPLAHDQDLRHGGDLGEQPQVGERPKRHVVAQVHVDGERAGGGDADGVAIWIGLGDGGGAGQPTCAGAVLDHHALAEESAHLIGEHAGKGIGRAAGWKRHHQLDGPAWELLGGGRQGRSEEEGEKARQADGRHREAGLANLRTHGGKPRWGWKAQGRLLKAPLSLGPDGGYPGVLSKCLSLGQSITQSIAQH